MPNPCIEEIIKAAKGEISEREATRILREMAHRTKAKAAKEQIPIEEAARLVGEEVALQEKLKAAVHKRAKLFSLRAYNRIITAATSGRGKNLSDSLIEYMAEAYNAGHYTAGKWLNKLASDLEEAGVLREFQKGGEALSHDVFTERWQLTSGQPFKTQNKAAQVIAKSIREVEKEYLALVRKHGAWTQDAPGYTGPQTHNPELLRRAGNRAGKAFGKENQDLSYKVWRQSIDALNIDWDRTLPGATAEEMDKFLKAFHQSVYSGVHGPAREITDPSKRLGIGSLAERISSERVLWFGDAESQWAYNQRWGNNDFNLATLGEIQGFGRNMAMLQYLGPSALETYQNAVKTLRERAAELPDAQEQVKKLERRSVQGAFDLLSGKAGSSTRPMVSRGVDFLKSWIIASKGGGIVFSMSGDRGFIDSSLARQGADGLHRLNVQLGRIALKTDDGKKILRSMGFVAHSFAGHVAERFSNDVRPFARADKALGWFFRLQGASQLNDVHKRTAYSAASERIGQLSGMAWDKLPTEMRTILEGYQFSQLEWDAVRSTAFKVGDEGEWTLIAPDRMQDLPDDVIDGLLDVDGLKKTQPNRSRKRDALESKMGAYFADVASEMVPTPGLRERLVMTGGGIQRGAMTREVLDLFFTFKGFGTTVALRNSRSYGKLWAAGQYQSVGVQVAMLLAQTTALGYLGWAAREILKGRTPPSPVDEDGSPNFHVFFESMKRGGGLGIYGDYMLTEYNRDNRSFLEAAVGPVLSELDPSAALLSSAIKTATGDQEPESFGLQSLRFAEANAPFINLFWSKFMLDQFVLWNLKEGLSPGILKRTERTIRDERMQEYFIEPVH